VITVGNYPDLASAQLAQSILDGEGIFTNIPDEHLAGIDWQMGTALHGVRLQVPPEDAERARELLSSVFPATQDEAEWEKLPASDATEEVCPSCGSNALGPPKWKNRLKAAALLFPPVLLLWPFFAAFGADRTCSACGRGARQDRSTV
jgi:hypothetical protein